MPKTGLYLNGTERLSDDMELKGGMFLAKFSTMEIIWKENPIKMSQ